MKLNVRQTNTDILLNRSGNEPQKVRAIGHLAGQPIAPAEVFLLGPNMLWFKHITNSTSDPDLMGAVSKFGPSGYYVFFMTLEILSKEKSFSEPLKMDWNAFCWRFPKVSKAKIEKILKYFDEKNRIKSSRNENFVSVFCHKLSELSSTYQKSLRNNLEQSVNIRRKKKEERKEKKKEAKASPLFNPLKDLFFNEYLRLTGVNYVPHVKDFAQLKLLVKNNVSSDRMLRAIHNCHSDSFHSKNFSMAYVCSNFSKLENLKTSLSREDRARSALL